MRRLALTSAALLLAILMGLMPGRGQANSAAMLSSVSGNPQFGISHIAYGNYPPQPSHYQWARDAGAQWNRWALYWPDVETSRGSYSFSASDATVIADVEGGFHTDVALLNTPSFYSTGGSPQIPAPKLGDRAAAEAYRSAQRAAAERGESLPFSAATTTPLDLYQPVFADGSDTWSPGKAINPNNYWARFVNTTVARYKPGGVLAAQRGWGPGQSISHWEMWNEPDFSFFWNGTTAEYARLLQVGYLAVKAADPSAKVLMGGLEYWEKPWWLGDALNALKAIPASSANAYFFDILPKHQYSRSKDLYDKVVEAQQIMASKGILGKDIWINETNLPACSDYAFPTQTCPSPGKGTLTDQTYFAVQATAYAFAAGVTRIIFHQMCDDGIGEAYGLYRNDGTARPVYTTYQVVAQYFRSFTQAARTTDGAVDRVAITGTPWGRVTALWKNTAGDAAYSLPATAAQAIRVYPNGQTVAVASYNGRYNLTLRGATNNNNFSGDPNDYIIGGEPVILLEAAGTATMDIEAPTQGATVSQPFTVSGWAIDTADPSGTGVGAVHVWAAPVSGGANVFLGAATYGSSRPSVGDTYGSRFTNSGFELRATGLPPGTYDITAFAYSTVARSFNDARVVRVTVVSGPVMSLDSPPQGATVSQPFTVSGWAIDTAASSGTGVSAVHVWAFPQGGGANVFLGAATYGGSRPAVGSTYGSRFTNSGFDLTVPAGTLPAGAYTIRAYAYSTVSASFSNSDDVAITVNGASNPAVQITSPTAGSSKAGSFDIAGWAIDRGAATGTGVSAVGLYAISQSTGGVTSLGLASYGEAMTDVAGTYGSQFLNSGFRKSLAAGTLSPGNYTIRAYAYSTVAGGWTSYADLAITIISGSSPVMGISSPGPGATLTGAFDIAGWAIDRGAAAGTGVSAVGLYAISQSTGGVTSLGLAGYGEARSDVAATYGSQFLNSGFRKSVAAGALSPGSYTIRAYAYSTVAGGWNNSSDVSITVASSSNPVMEITAPTSGITVTQPFDITGWAIDRGAATGTGVSAVGLYAISQSTGGVTSLGLASYGGAQPSVATSYGSQFLYSGFRKSVSAGTLPPGTYIIRAYAYSTVAPGWNNHKDTTATVR
ncbi:MAG: hypothetical protein M1370_10130 [Bacteroidetes bacterium]|nr:hypothetical protein [Bacteroidota bacterium]MCL5024981.1 hypothetical protein [Chloroflexota bacterium]